MYNFYELLGIKKDATQREIKSAYVRLIKIYHPDLAKGNPEFNKKAQIINEAYTILKDPIKRSKYDSMLLMNEKYGTDNVYENEYGEEFDDVVNDGESVDENSQIPNIVCEKCGRDDSTLRVTIFINVFSVIIYSVKNGWVKVLCSRCRIKYCLLWCTEVWFFGWWSLHGFFWSIDALFKNAKGGIQPKENNIPLLRLLAYKFYKKQKYNDAYESIHSAIQMSTVEDENDKKFLIYLNNLKNSNKELITRILNVPTFIFGYSYLTVLLISTILLFSLGNYNNTKKDVSYNKPKVTYTPPITKPPIQRTKEPEKKNIGPKLEKLSLPKSGVMKFYSKKKRIAPFKITASSFQNHYIKIYQYSTNKLVMTIFLRKGEFMETNLPLGIYGIKYATGEIWYGEKHLFGEWTTYFEAKGAFECEIVNDRIRGWEIQLYLSPSGNLQTDEIDEENF